MAATNASMLAAELIDSYNKALYSFEHNGRRIPLRIGQRCAELCDLLLAMGSAEAFCLTAWNPFSQRQTDESNEAAQAQLRTALDTLGALSLPAWGESADGSWEAEPGMLVFNIDRAQAIELGQRFRQNALLSIAADGTASLLLLR